jgi:hypothetical protein
MSKRDPSLPYMEVRLHLNGNIDRAVDDGLNEALEDINLELKTPASCTEWQVVSEEVEAEDFAYDIVTLAQAYDISILVEFRRGKSKE